MADLARRALLPNGMRDILPPESARWRRFVHVFAQVAERAGYGQIISPMLEDLGVFQRIGAATDVVSMGLLLGFATVLVK